jgi:hypothetical protein
MGADFLERATPTFKKCWDEGRLWLVNKDLMTRLPASRSRSFAANVTAGAVLRKGDQTTVEKIGSSLIASLGHTELARCENAPAELAEAIEANCGIVQGEVDEVHELAGIVEISICLAKPE